MKLIIYRKKSDKCIVISDTNIEDIDSFVEDTKEMFKNKTASSYTIKTGKDIIICDSDDISAVQLAELNINSNNKNNYNNDDLLEEDYNDIENNTNIEILDDEEDTEIETKLDEESKELIKNAINNIDNEENLFDNFDDNEFIEDNNTNEISTEIE